jgi:hypothetical protein
VHVTPFRLAAVSGYNGDGVITVYASDGPYSLYLATRELRIPSGEGLILTEEQARDVANSFQAIIDDAATQIETKLADNGGECCAQLRMPGPAISGIQAKGSQDAATARDGKASSGKRNTLFRKKSKDGKKGTSSAQNIFGSPERAAPMFSASASAPTHRTRSIVPNPTAIASYLAPRYCWMIASDIYNATPTWRYARDNYNSALRGLGDRIRAIVLENFQHTGSLINLLNWGDVAFQIGAEMGSVERWHLEESLARNDLELLARAYGENNCWNPSSPWWYPQTYSSGSGSGSWTWFCWYEQWEISFDGGVTWSPIEIKNCQWAL